MTGDLDVSVPQSLFSAAGEMEAARRKMEERAVRFDHNMTLVIPTTEAIDLSLACSKLFREVGALLEQA